MNRRPIPADRLHGLLSEAVGLTAADVAAQRQRYGRNQIVEAAGFAWWTIALDTARDPMLWFLAATAALYALLGDYAESITLLVATVPLLGMDAALHWRTQASTAGLRTHLATRANVLRDGARAEIPAEDLVPGDLALVGPGEMFPADGVVIAGRELQVDESVLTGESFPVSKRPLEARFAELPEAASVEHWGMAGTRLLTGSASLRIVLTGSDTLYGEIVRSARSGSRGRTPLQLAIGSLVNVLAVAAAALCIALAVVRLRQGYGWADALVSALTLAVAALPEEYPVAFAFFLAVGVFRLARRKALVRRATSVENIGRVSCICSDKTGTITEGRLRLTHVVAAPGIDERRLLELAALASRREAHDPLDAAILREAALHGAAPAAHEIVSREPFTEDTRRETVVVRRLAAGAGEMFAATKGSIEVVLELVRLDAPERALWVERAAGFAREAHKVIACAWRGLEPGGQNPSERDREYRMAGLLAFEDPVREGVAGAIDLCRRAGIHTVMVTGDHPLTAGAVAREIGLGGREPRVRTADELEGSLGEGRALDASEVDVIARAVPGQKLRLVRALQASGEIVAVTGDGVNDVPALQAADIGIAMGERGTRSAREVAAIVLLDDNFRTIVSAIAEGRQLFLNLKLCFGYLLMIHLPLVVTAALIPLAGYPMLYLPVHIVWLELIIHPTALLVFQELPARGRIAPSSGRRPRVFSAADWASISLVGVGITCLVAAGYALNLGEGGDVPHARAAALAGLTFASAALTAFLSRLRSWLAGAVVAATAATSVLLIQTPALASRLHLAPLHAADWAGAAAGALLICLPALFRPRRHGRAT